MTAEPPQEPEPREPLWTMHTWTFILSVLALMTFIAFESFAVMFGLLTAAWLIPSLAGPVIAGALAGATSWRFVFAVILAGSALALLGLLRVTRAGSDPTAPAPKSTVWAGIVGRNGQLALLAAALLASLHLSGGSAPPWSAVIAASASVGLIVTARGILPTGTLLLRGAPQRLVALRAVLGATVTTTDVYLTL